MMIIIIGRKPLKIAVIAILVCSLGFIFYSYIANENIRKAYEPKICIVDQSGKSSLASFLNSMGVSFYGQKDLEIFDIYKGKVVKRIKPDSVINKVVEGHLEGITGMYAKVKAFPDKGYIIRIPLEPPIKIQSKWLNVYGINSVDEVFILFPEQGVPYLLVLDEKKRPLFYNFEGNTDYLMEKLGY
ncbi:MAG: hypothetical protein FIA99_13585 [Ruminiclostridium sp.]|nr:hypothetical protein [Ruminiclostridium sp.]